MRAAILSSRRLRPFAALALSAAATAGVAIHAAGCQQQATTVAVRSLERSGRVSFVCLGPPAAAGSAEHELSDCSQQQFTDINEYLYEDDAGDIDAGSGAIPHLYALVTQTTRGEIAVVDLSATQRNVLDENPIEPGANFLPVGGQPTAIVSTPGGVASFVAVSEIGRAGIFALPSARIRPLSTVPTDLGGAAGNAAFAPEVPQLSSWPACALPSAPGDMILVADPLDDNGFERTSCDATPTLPTSSEQISFIEAHGRQKLVVAMPDLGGIAVLDAETILDQPPGAFDACPVERWLPLAAVDPATLGGNPPLPAPPADGSCVNPQLPQPAYQGTYTPRPAGLAYVDGTLYVADLDAPVIHVVDMPTPCEPVERAPLVPSSADEPQRVVFTSKVSVSPQPTPDLKRYLYASDVEDGSLMVFDVGPTSTSRRPLQRQHPEWNPFEPRDRLRFAAPVADVMVIQRDSPVANPATGLAPAGVRCDPDPTKAVCTATSTSCELGTTYQTDRDTYTSGAGPTKLRGTFAFAALTNGRIGVIDVDDFDAPCRGPSLASSLYGCATNSVSGAQGQNTSWEESCNVVLPNAVRAASYDVVSDNVGNHVPGVTNLPVLYDINGAVLDPTTGGAQMLAPTPSDPGVPTYSTTGADGTSLMAKVGNLLFVGGGVLLLDDVNATTGLNTLVMNLEDPRAHLTDQSWSAVFEGAIPGFDQRLAELRLGADPDKVGLYDPSSRFCASGVQSKAAVEAYAPLQSLDTAPARLADYVQIASELPDAELPYWDGAACTYQACSEAYGTIEAPTTNRDLMILEAYEDHLDLAARPPDDGNQPPPFTTMKCCFPDLVTFNVRVGSQWIVLGDLTGFLHHVVADQTTGVCRNACDSTLARKNGRAYELPHGSAPADDDPLVFLNPMFRFAITSGDVPSTTNPDRDNIFRWQTTGSFSPMLINLSPDSTSLVQPQAMTFLSPTGELAVTDGALNGLIFVNLSAAAYSRSFY